MSLWLRCVNSKEGGVLNTRQIFLSQSYLASLQIFTMAKLKQCSNQNTTFNLTDVVSVSLGCSTRIRRCTGARISSNAIVMVSVGLL